MRQTKYVVIFPDGDPLTMIGSHDNGLFHNIEDMRNSFIGKLLTEIDDDKLILTDCTGYKVIGQIHKVQSFL